MLTATCELESITPLSFNKKLITPRNDNEPWEEYEKRVWRERCDCNGEDQMIIRGIRFRYALAEAAKLLKRKIQGKGNTTYMGPFDSGVIVKTTLSLDTHRADVEGEWVYTSPKPKDPKRWICFPVIPEWSGLVEVAILNPDISPEVFREHFEAAGMLVGIGRWRPVNRGEYGRFQLIDLHCE